MSLIVCFSGKIGSGKSSVLTALGDKLHWKCTGFGDYLRAEIVKAGGDPSSREALQDMGKRLVESDPDGFCRAVLAYGDYQPGDNLFVDGVRHVDIFTILKRIAAPADVRLIFLSVTDDVQRSRVTTRSDSDDLVRAIGHTVEFDLAESLPQRADANIDADQPFDDVVASCVHTIQSWMKK